LTALAAEPNFASQGSPGPGRALLLGKGDGRHRARGLAASSPRAVRAQEPGQATELSECRVTVLG
jgi:hypothetical protein